MHFKKSLGLSSSLGQCVNLNYCFMTSTGFTDVLQSILSH